MGTQAFSAQWSKSLRHVLLLPSSHSTPSLRSVAQGRLHSTPSLRSVAQGRLLLLTTDASRRIFESALERVRRSFRLHLYGYVVMPEHVHLLLSEPQGDNYSDHSTPLKPKDGLNGPPAHCIGPSARKERASG
jgi:hypothetical protein